MELTQRKLRRGRRINDAERDRPQGLASHASLKREIRLALRFVSRASVDSVQFPHSVHSVTGQFLSGVVAAPMIDLVARI